MKNLLKSAYTLAEVIIVMLIIAVVVSVTIKLTRAKLDNITSYTYYTAYNTVRAVAVEMLRDFNPEQKEYDVAESNPAPAEGSLCPADKSRNCGKEKQWDEAACDCLQTPQTVSRKGKGFCKLFVSYTNTSQLAEGDECKGDEIEDNETEFADKDPDIILRNGMILFNVSQDPVLIAELAGNSKNIKYIDEADNEIDVDTWGYKLYVDIDGARNGEGRLWEDVYPFYVTLSGTVIPAYDMDNDGLSGGDSRLHLQTSVYDEFVDGAGRHTEWITKSRTFKDSACTMGYVNPSTPYCSGVAANNQCAQQNHDCRLKTVMPVKFFGF